ncbi:hypothetical protein HDV00_012497, partial [Rhizophlyctis rosea]
VFPKTSKEDKERKLVEQWGVLTSVRATMTSVAKAEHDKDREAALDRQAYPSGHSLLLIQPIINCAAISDHLNLASQDQSIDRLRR